MTDHNFVLFDKLLLAIESAYFADIGEKLNEINCYSRKVMDEEKYLFAATRGKY
jgi:hypothetical protein